MSSESVCAICMEHFQNNSRVYSVETTPCKHPFHNSCLTTYLAHWLSSFDQNSNPEEEIVYVSAMPTCPLCRSELSDPKMIISPFQHVWHITNTNVCVSIPFDSHWMIGPYYGFSSKTVVDYSHDCRSNDAQHKRYIYLQTPIQDWQLPLVTLYSYSLTGIMGMSRKIQTMSCVILNVNTQKIYVIL